MKYLFVVFVVFGVAVCTIDAVAPPPPANQITPASVELGYLLQDTISKLAQELVQYLNALILEFVPATAQVPLVPVLLLLKSLKTHTIGTIIVAILNLLKINADTLLQILPDIVLNEPINVNDLAVILLSEIPEGTKTVPLSTFLSLAGAYVQNVLTVNCINLINSAG